MYTSNVFAVVLCVFSVSGRCDRIWEDGHCEAALRTDAGWVCGRVRAAEDGTEYASFRDVPYAEQPIGPLRFKNLVRKKHWSGYLDCTEDGPACPQKELIYGLMTQYKKGMSEECIHLNLHMPYHRLPSSCQDSCGGGLPILVMIHGGGFQTGSKNTDIHGPEYFMTEQVIVITFNYRINIPGFLCLNSEEVPGNQGLRDQIALLQWVQRNARAFGGDPDDVTLMGQSAGASCVHLLSLSKAAVGLFHRVILISGTAISNYFTTSPNFAKDIANAFLAELGINSTDPAYIHRQLVKLPILDMMRANTVVQNNFGLTSFVPCVDKVIIDDTPLNLIAKGRGGHLPFLVGFTDQEAEMFKWMFINMNMMQRLKDNPAFILSPQLIYSLPEDELECAIQEANDKCFNGTYTLEKFLQYLSYSFFKYPALKLAEWRSSSAPVYLYKYAYRSSRSLIKEALWLMYEGAVHVEDLTFMFRVNSMLGDYRSFPPKNSDDHMKRRMTRMITNFMTCSNPTCSEDEVDWPRYCPDSPQYQLIDHPHRFRMAEPTTEELDMVAFFDSIDVECRDLRK